MNGHTVSDLRALLCAKFTFIWINTEEERRVERAVAEVWIQEEKKLLAAAKRPTDGAGKGLRFWDCEAGIRDLFDKTIEPTRRSDSGEATANDLPGTLPAAAFDSIRARKGRELWLLRDIHKHMDDPAVVRGLKNLASELQDEEDFPGRGAVIVALSPTAAIPLELRGSASVMEWPLPEREELGEMLDTYAEVLGEKPDDRQAIVEAAAGLSAKDAADAFVLSHIQAGRISPVEIARAKQRIIQREGGLTWWPPDPRGLEAVGGLEALKRWLLEWGDAMQPGAREAGIKAPRGLLLAGVPGCGKSSAAKAIPAAWGGWPLLRLDLGGLKGSLVGQSEESIRRALRLADAMGRVVLWIDEIGKALAGATGPSGDSGVAADQLGELLFWMEEHSGESFVVATTNEQLPPELTRRFSATFFVDLPTATERAAILAVLLHACGRDPGKFDLPAIAAVTRDWSGGELDKLVQAGLLRAWRDGHREPETEDFVDRAKGFVPIAKSDENKIRAMQSWAKGRAMRASDEEENAGVQAPSAAQAIAQRLRGAGGLPQ